MKKPFRSMIALCLASVVAVPTAFAFDDTYHGSHTNLSDLNEPGRVPYNEFGIFHPTQNGVPALVNCSTMTHSTLSDVIRVHFTGYDRHTTFNTACFFRGQSRDGTTLWTANLQTSGFSSAAMTVDGVTLPINSTAVVSLSCTIPPSVSNGPSRVTSYRVEAN